MIPVVPAKVNRLSPWEYDKVRYRGLHKNANRLFVACGLVNIYMARRQLRRPT